MSGTYVSGCIVPGECRELPGEYKGAGVKCYGKGNAKECQGNVRKRLQIARGKQGNVRGQYGSGCKVPGECRGMQVNTRETYRSVNCQVNAGECQGNISESV